MNAPIHERICFHRAFQRAINDAVSSDFEERRQLCSNGWRHRRQRDLEVVRTNVVTYDSIHARLVRRSSNCQASTKRYAPQRYVFELEVVQHSSHWLVPIAGEGKVMVLDGASLPGPVKHDEVVAGAGEVALRGKPVFDVRVEATKHHDRSFRFGWRSQSVC